MADVDGMVEKEEDLAPADGNPMYECPLVTTERQ